MGNETKSNGASSLGGGGGGFRAKMEHYVYSGEKKHVLAGIGIFTVIFGIPWYLMNRGPFFRSRSTGFLLTSDNNKESRYFSSSNVSSYDDLI
ncbi:hypothetical protein DY000_02062119 [Brassica cretica]|uniref:Transmembrane protein n=2 Tax=Brassica cretica TaxID=69181 RepID=A0ABQ7AXE7_BRACR|nr:hypothetical protein DY000_02062119 [Brassica cretica]